MNTLKLVDPRYHRKDIVSLRRMKLTGKAEDKKKVLIPILVRFNFFEQKVMVVKVKKITKC